LQAAFDADPKNWQAVEALMIEARAQKAAIPAAISFGFAAHAAAMQWHDKAFAAAKEAAATPVYAKEGWKLAYQVGIQTKSAPRTAEAVKNLLIVDPTNDRFVRQAMKTFRDKGPTPASTLIIKEAAPYLPVDAELFRYTQYVEDSPELAAKLAEWACSLPETASPVESLDALNFLLEQNIEPPAQLLTNILENPDPELNDRQRLRALLRAYDHAGKREKAVEIYTQFADMPGREGLLVRFLPYSRSVPGLTERLLDWARAAGPNSTESKRKAALKIFAFNGMVPPDQLTPTEASDDKTKRAWQLWAEHVPTDAELKRPVMASYSGDEIVVSPNGKPGPVVIVFSGLSDNFAVPPPTFDRFLASLGASGIYMSDKNRLCFGAGAKAMGMDFNETVEYLQEQLDDLKCTRLVTLGTSAGGYAAMLYGLNMDAHSVLAFGSVTNATPEYLSTDPRGRLVAKRAARQVEAKNLDIRPMLNLPTNATDVHLYFGADMEHDSRNARHLEGQPRVTLHPMAGFDQHQVLRELVVRGEFKDVLSSALYG
jgi:tetratricopeptide (TPR) repeat protein